MHLRLRATLVPLLALVVAASFDLESLLHAHRDGEPGLRARDWTRIDSPAPCADAAPHWDRARPDHQPACAACLVSASPLDRAGVGAVTAPAGRTSSSVRGRSGRPPASARTGVRAGRAPPARLSPA